MGSAATIWHQRPHRAGVGSSGLGRSVPETRSGCKALAVPDEALAYLAITIKLSYPGLGRERCASAGILESVAAAAAAACLPGIWTPIAPDPMAAPGERPADAGALQEVLQCRADRLSAAARGRRRRIPPPEYASDPGARRLAGLSWLRNDQRCGGTANTGSVSIGADDETPG